MKRTSDPIRILLAAYQGERYLRPLLDSLLNQENVSIQIIASDDNSSDGSAQILAEYAAAYPETVIHHHSGLRFGSSQAHFLYLLRNFGDAPYLMFCDQDDVWHPDKVSQTLNAMLRLCPDPAVPALIHTDLRVVDAGLHEQNPSFLRFSSLDGHRVQFHQLLVQNVVTGCTMMINHALALLYCSASNVSGILMHDWYLALLAAACGKIGFLDIPTIDYRQHGNNVVGAKDAHSPAYLLSRLKKHDMHDAFLATTQQAASLLEHYGDAMPQEYRTLCQIFSELPQHSKFQRLQTYRRFHLYKAGLIRRIGQIIWW